MSLTKEIHLLGVSFRTAPVAVREALSFDRWQAAAFLAEAAAATADVEALVLSTCNRTEFVLAAPAGDDPAATVLLQLRRLRPDAPVLRDDCHRYQLAGDAAARHLFRVACGLESAVLGDAQILGQLRDALATASTAGALGGTVARVVQHGLRVGRRARAETAFGRGGAGTGSAIAGLLAARPGGAGTVVLVGAGETARDVARQLAKRRLGRLVVVNRTAARAHELTHVYGGTTRPWAELADALCEADAIVAATAAPSPVLDGALLARVVAAGRLPLVVDAGMPRNVAAGAPLLVVDLDGIRERRDETLAARRAAVPAVERLVDEELGRWDRWRARRPLDAVIEALYRDLAAASRRGARDLVAGGPPSQDRAELVLRRAMKRVLHGHVRRLRDATTPAGRTS